MIRVKLKPAWGWDCEECGQENFCLADVAEYSPAKAVTEPVGLRQHQWYLPEAELPEAVAEYSPAKAVACGCCGAVYAAESDC